MMAEQNVANRHVPARITEYLGNGGLWNPELMDHQAVRDLLIDARDVVETFERKIRELHSALYTAHIVTTQGVPCVCALCEEGHRR